MIVLLTIAVNCRVIISSCVRAVIVEEGACKRVEVADVVRLVASLQHSVMLRCSFNMNYLNLHNSWQALLSFDTEMNIRNVSRAGGRHLPEG